MTVEFTSNESSALDTLLSVRTRHRKALEAAMYDMSRKISAAEHLIHCFNTVAVEKHKGLLRILEIAPCDDDLVVTFDYGTMPLDEVSHLLSHFKDCHAEEGLHEDIYFCDAWVRPAEDIAQFVVHHHFSEVRAKNCQMVLALTE